MAVDPFLRMWKQKENIQTPNTGDANTQVAKTQGANTPATANNTPQKIQAPVTKKGTTISLWSFLLGCLVLIILSVGIGAVFLYNVMSNPEQVAAFGMTLETIQSLLKSFTALFFGFLFFIGFGLMVVNAYRLITVKNKPKLWYIIGTIGWFAMLLFSVGLGAALITRINDMNVNQSIDGNSLLLPYINFKDGPQYLLANENVKIIAPATLSYDLNGAIFNAQVYPTLGVVDIQSITLNCGNDTALTLDSRTLKFDGTCFYPTKGDYNLSIDIAHTNRQTQERNTTSIAVGTLTVPTQIDIQVKDGETSMTEAEVVAGKVPRKITFDASAVFRDYGIADYVISWDLDDDGTTDRENAAIVTQVYNAPKVYNINVRFPTLNGYLYTFPLRIEQSDVPVCLVSATQKQWVEYILSTTFVERNTRIDEYGFSIIDLANDQVIQRIKATTNQIDYNFPGGGEYAVKVDFVTNEGKQGSCESNNFTVGDTDFDISYDVFFKSPQEPNFQKVTDNTEVVRTGDSITVRQLPTILQIRITDIQPVNPDATVRVFFNNSAILALQDNVYEINVRQESNNTIQIIVEDTARNARTQKNIDVQTSVVAIDGKLLITPNTVGWDPFTVTFDASTTTLRDTEDEIVYFTWDFGDGEIKTNVSQAIMQHTYRYDYDKENGTYYPKVTITTKKGRTATIASENILVKKAVQSAKIRVDSHPGQIAKIGDKVEYVLEVSGLPKRVIWDFGNGKTLECDGRQCITVATSYEQTGNYTCKVTVEYFDQPTIEGSINLKVQ